MTPSTGLWYNYSPLCNRLRFSAGMYQIKTIAAFGHEMLKNELCDLNIFENRKKSLDHPKGFKYMLVI